MPLGYCPICKKITEIKFVSVSQYESHKPLVACGNKECGMVRLGIKTGEGEKYG